MTFPAFGDTLSKTNPALEPLGIGLLQQSMGAAARVAYPSYDGGFMLGSSDTPILGVFQWSGVEWTADIVLKRLAFFGLGIVVALVASSFFDRFDPSRQKLRSKPRKGVVSLPELQPADPALNMPVSVTQALPQPVRLTPLTASATGFTFLNVMVSELKLLLKGQRWWWYVIAVGLIIASLVNKADVVRTSVLPIAWLWPVLIWSGLGNREVRHNTQQMVFSSAAPLMRQLPASWLAGFLLAVFTGSGAVLKLLGAGDGVGLLAWFSAALFIPSFALALGIWSNSHKLFEVLYISMWYLAMNKLAVVDFFGANSNGNVWFFLPFSMALIVAAFVGRARQLQN